MADLTRDEAISAIVNDSITEMIRRVDIYEEDGATPYFLNAPLEKGGTITADASRDERRMIQLSLNGSYDPEKLAFQPRRLWYDKVVKPFKGIKVGDDTYEEQVGEFVIDGISDENFPSSIAISGRDYSKRLLKSKFSQPISFPAGTPIERVISTIAVNGGVTNIQLPPTGQITGSDYLFDGDVARWKAIQDIATGFGHEAFFTAEGVMIMQPVLSPAESPILWTYQTGVSGTIASQGRRVHDDRLFNHFIVIGEGGGTVPVYAEAKNEDPASVTSIQEIGQRTAPVYRSSFVTTVEQARRVAENFLAVSSLNSFEVDLGALWLPGIEPGRTVRYIDTRAEEGASDLYFLNDFTIPLDPGLMSLRLNRIELVTLGRSTR